MHPPLVPGVDRPRDEPDVAGLVAAINVLAVHFEARVIPTRQRDHVFEKKPLVRAPLGSNGYAAGAVVLVPGVLGVVAATDGCAKAPKQALALHVVGDDCGEPSRLATGRARPTFAAAVATCRAAEPKVREKNLVRLGAAGASDEDAFAPDAAFDGKFAEPVARARERVFVFEASSLAAFQEPLQRTL